MCQGRLGHFHSLAPLAALLTDRSRMGRSPHLDLDESGEKPSERGGCSKCAALLDAVTCRRTSVRFGVCSVAPSVLLPYPGRLRSRSRKKPEQNITGYLADQFAAQPHPLREGGLGGAEHLPADTTACDPAPPLVVQYPASTLGLVHLRPSEFFLRGPCVPFLLNQNRRQSDARRRLDLFRDRRTNA